MRTFGAFWITVFVMCVLILWRVMSDDDKRDLKALIRRYWWEPLVVFTVVWFAAYGLSAFSIKLI